MAARAKVVLHLGAHKTGTSTIQKYLRDRPRELARMRIAYIPRSDCNRLIGWGLVPRNEPEKLRSAVLATMRRPLWKPLPAWAGSANRPRTVVLSHENSLGRPVGKGASSLYPGALERAEGLYSSIGDLDLRLVYYIRSQESFLQSYYLQHVHEGGFTSFDQWLSAIDLERISWRPAVEALATVFGAEHVVVRDFADITRGQNSYLEEFLRICDPTLAPTVNYPPKRNISLSQQGLDLALAMNPLISTRGDRVKVRKFLQANFNNTKGARPALLTPELADQIRARYEAENDSIITEFGAVRDS